MKSFSRSAIATFGLLTLWNTVSFFSRSLPCATIPTDDQAERREPSLSSPPAALAEASRDDTAKADGSAATAPPNRVNDSSVSRAKGAETEDIYASEPCLPYLEIIRRRQDCFRRRSARGGVGGDVGDDVESSSSFSCNDNESGPPFAGPLYNYAFYAGQGFGRVFEHTVAHCLIAAGLQRPCLVDVDPRDEFYTWRSFIEMGSFDWDPTSKLTNRTNAQIVDAIGKMNGPGAGHWDEVLEYDDVLPMVKDDNASEAEKMTLWDGRNGDHGQKILLSPNWGTAWFPNMGGVLFRKGLDPSSKCDRQRLVTLVQNDMYRPTTLSLRLHDKRREAVVNGTSDYGALHLRTHFMKEGMKAKTFKLSSLIIQIDKCLSSLSDTGVKVWWIITDDPGIVPNITAALAPAIDLRSGYTDGFGESIVHSNSNEARGKLTHAAMAPSILDWVAIHESKVAVVGGGGAYGETGARGHGRVQSTAPDCGMFHAWRPQ